MNILVYGAGPLGSLFAARLHDAGHDVSLLARGQRFEDLRQYGIVLQDFYTNERTVTQVKIADSLKTDDAYDLVLVIMRKNHALETLPVLASNLNTPNVLFLGNNFAGPTEYIDALGKERVLIGFPTSAGYFDGHTIITLSGTEDDPWNVPFGEPDGSTSDRTLLVGQIIDSMPGYKAEIRTDMEAWLKYHVALLFPSIGPALYGCDTDNYRMARTRDAVVLAVRAIREGFRVLRTFGYPVTPSSLRIFEILPEPILVPIFQKRIVRQEAQVAVVGHAKSARSEVKHLTDEFLVFARKTCIATPAIDILYNHIDPEYPHIPDGSATLSLDWRRVYAGAALVVGFIGGMVLADFFLRGERIE
jgi:ketopantoate reductase